MARELDYLVKIEGNEALLDRFIDAINNDKCTVATDYPNPYVLDTGERFLNSKIIDYFFKTTPFTEDTYIAFFEKMRILSGFNSYSYTLGVRLKDLIATTFTNIKKFGSRLAIDPSTTNPPTLSLYEDELLRVLCYLAIGHIKYDDSHAIVTADEYFKLAEKLGSKRVQELYEKGTCTISEEITHYQDNQITFFANDVTAVITIEVQDDKEDTYRKVLTLINTLFKHDFPKSFAIEFIGPNLKDLGIENLPICGQHYLFATAIQYESLHPLMINYINTVMIKWKWYENIDEEFTMMPSTFAVMSLALYDRRYFDILIKYYRTVDDEHQSTHQHFTLPFLEKYGIDADSIKVFIQGTQSMQEQPHLAAYTPYFTSIENLKLLLESKENFADYYFTDEDKEDYGDEEEIAEMEEYCWDYVMYTIYGTEDDYATVTKDWDAEALALFEQLTQKKN
ncbi:DUF6138 family protein [Myroides sp. M-43]|uniref:DUF6138 family protein n=1 Tax=Myroides oncorhynchi TaxID=2893756 RepID=UPI001E2A5ED6|nr:DUF6138 family protein [Myroides oncorhynchi]MCC9042718.1 DUF6138 family protein [Myroides oncorhynchi]